MSEFATMFNKLADAYIDREDDIDWIKAKLVDLEERSRYNIVKICGIPKNSTPTSLREYFTKLLSDILLNAPPLELILNCIHKFPKPAHLLDKVLRDLLVLIHFYFVKDKLLRETMNPGNILNNITKYNLC